MVKKVTISSKGQITLPKVLREKYHLTDGETAVILDSGDGITIKHTQETLRGLLKGKIDANGFERELKKLRKEWMI
ncbi:MAG: AbrB/MazE/SpoVT family DNA-binding domain-containing protein [Thermoplasmatales archaeon]|nr:AbrB/MazE/SpoVT family DNA-binding domain-containing protein [Thermoplasmatales archaeon]